MVTRTAPSESQAAPDTDDSTATTTASVQSSIGELEKDKKKTRLCLLGSRLLCGCLLRRCLLGGGGLLCSWCSALCHATRLGLA